MQLRRSCPLLAVVDTDTLRVQWEGAPRLVRLLDARPERATPGGYKPPTDFGRRTLRWMKEDFLQDAADVVLEFPDEDVSLSNGGKLLCHVIVRGESLNVRLVREGWSPCFEKYGRPRIHREALEHAELRARYEGEGIWGDRGGRSDYHALKAWWSLRAGLMDDCRRAIAMGEDVLCCRLFYREIVARADTGTAACVFADLARPYRMTDGSTIFQLGSPQQPLTAYFPPEASSLAGFVDREFLGTGRPNYLYFRGPLSLAGDHPQITIDLPDHVSTCPPSHQ